MSTSSGGNDFVSDSDATTPTSPTAATAAAAATPALIHEVVPDPDPKGIVAAAAAAAAAAAEISTNPAAAAAAAADHVLTPFVEPHPGHEGVGGPHGQVEARPEADSGGDLGHEVG